MDEMKKKRAARIVAGTLAGAGAAWFLTSRLGAGTRQKIRDIAQHTKELGMELGHETAEKTRDLISLSREVSSDDDWKEAIETQELDSESKTLEASNPGPAPLSDKEAAAADIVPFPHKLPDLR
ncbi:YtxH domain-containing protein [Saccharibacillus qingshengii]|uniref:YtxH domain-containing protein n=1 Tax=Saccharibacillus qingshengii TaxID=1763540 RepID=UPI001553417A|nr:YtxH domain-containing protein [Saccharibacillus qingshengii]